MNRIRKLGNKYEILITPNLLYQTGLELMLGNWTDKNFDGFKVEQYESIDDAINALCNYPDINFDQLILYHKEIYNKLYEIIVGSIQNLNFAVYVTPKLIDANTLRETLFDRVKILGNNFRLLYNLTDIISYTILCSQQNMNFILNLFTTNQALRILYQSDKSTKNKKMSKLVGQTDIGTVYEIICITNL